MTRTLRLLSLVAALAAPAALTAQNSSRPVSVGISGGLSLPTGDFGDGLQSGYSVAGHLFLSPAAMRSLRFRGDVSYDSWDFEQANTNTNASIRSLGVIANALFDVSTSSTSTVKPYFLGGLGLFNSKASGNNSDSNSDLGAQLGAGLNFKLSGFSTFLEAKYVNVFADGSNVNWIPITFGVRF